MRKLIDVSEHQGKINWEKVKPQIDGAILRCGYGMDITRQDDKEFRRNADECTRLNIPFGVYLYSYADSDEKAKSEAAHVLRLIEGYKLSYPVYLDLEENGTQGGAIGRAKIFGQIIEKAGYWCGIYANLYWWKTHLVGLEAYTKWVAQYSGACDYKGKNLDMWQYTSTGSIAGIAGNVDMNVCYRDLPGEILKEADHTVPEKETYTLEQFIRQVQSVTGSRVDGIAGPETIGNTVTVSRYINSRHPVVRHIQKRLMALGYPLGIFGADGVFGSETEAAVLLFQERNGCWEDGEVTARNKTWRKLLGME